MTAPRLRPYAFTIGQPVSVCGMPATVQSRLRTQAGHALYRVRLAGERFNRTIREDGLRAAEQMAVAA